jgi:hypothetical protein
MKITRQQLRNLIREQLEQAAGSKYRVGDVVRVRMNASIWNKALAKYENRTWNKDLGRWVNGPRIFTLEILQIPGIVSDGSTSWDQPRFLGVERAEPGYTGTDAEDDYVYFDANQVIPDD